MRVWSGIRGGSRELAYLPNGKKKPSFVLRAFFYIEDENDRVVITYCIEIVPGYPDESPEVISEYLDLNGQALFDAYLDPIGDVFMVDVGNIGPENLLFRWDPNRSVLSQIQPHLAGLKFGNIYDLIENVEDTVTVTVELLSSMRYFDFNPDAMRVPTLIGQDVLGDRGENLSSVLYAICQDAQRKQALLSWVEELTPMDAVDFEFPADQIGRILLTVVERNGQRTSAYSQSDGMLRFLAILAVFLGPERAKFYFFEELENGIHPTRLHLLTQFIENQVAKGDIQVVASTHSPLLLNYIKPETLEYASLLYRLETQPDAHIKRIVDIPNARQLIEKQGVMRLYESGWFEDVLFLLDDEAPEVEAVA